MAEQIVELAPSESKVVSFEVTPAVAKSYSVSVDGLSGSFTAIGVPDIRLRNLRFVPTSPKAGDTVYIYATAQNYGTGTGSRKIDFRVTPPGDAVAQWETRTVTLAPGESITISSRFYTALEGTHYVSVDGLTGSFTCTGIFFQVGIGIYDEQGSPVAGNIFVDGTWYTTPRTLSLKLGDHAFVVAVPKGYIFLRVEIYDGVALITQKGFWLMIDRNTVVRAIARPKEE